MSVVFMAYAQNGPYLCCKKNYNIGDAKMQLIETLWMLIVSSKDGAMAAGEYHTYINERKRTAVRQA